MSAITSTFSTLAGIESSASFETYGYPGTGRVFLKGIGSRVQASLFFAGLSIATPHVTLGGASNSSARSQCVASSTFGLSYAGSKTKGTTRTEEFNLYPSLSTAISIEDKEEFAMYFENLKTLASMEDDWDNDGAEAPNVQALEMAGTALHFLKDMGFSPSGIVPSAEDGVGIFFKKDGRYADIEFFNDGEIAFLIDDRQSVSQAWSVEAESGISAALKDIKDFIDGNRTADSFRSSRSS